MKIKKLDFKTVPDAGVLVFMGRTKSGKTNAMRGVMYEKCRRFKKCIVMTGSNTAAVDFGENIPGCFIHEGFHEQLLERIVDKQDLDQKLGKCEPIVIVLDDLAYLADHIKNLEIMRRIFYNGRHYKILLLLSFQYCKSFPPNLRDQIAFVFCTFNKNPLRRKSVFETFNNVFDSFDTFDTAMVTLTENYKVMVLDHSNNASNRIEDNVFWYKAPFPALKWRMNSGGSMWRFHKNRYDPRYFLRPRQAPEPQPTTTRKKPATRRKRKSTAQFET